MATRRRQVFYTVPPVGGGINIGPGALIPAIGIGYALGVASSLSVVTPQAGVKGVGTSSGVILRRRQVNTPPPGTVKGVGYATGQEQTTILLNSSYIPKSTGIGTSTGTAQKAAAFTPTAATGIGTSTGRIGRTKTILSSGILAGTKGIGYATGQLYPINNIGDLVTAAKGVGTSTGVANRKVVARGSGQGQGSSVGSILVSHSLRTTAAVGIGYAVGAIRRSHAVNTTAAIGIGYATGVLAINGTEPIVSTPLSTGIGYSTGAIRRTLRISGAPKGIGYAVAAVVTSHTKQVSGSAVGIGYAIGAVNRNIRVTPATPRPTGVGTSVGAVRIFINLNFIGNFNGIGYSTGRIRRTLHVSGAVIGIGYAVGVAVKGGSKQILSTPLSTGIGTSTGRVRRRMSLSQLSSKGIGYSIGVLQVNGGTLTWAPAFDAGLVTAFNPLWYHPMTVHTFTVFAKLVSGSSVRVRLYNVTDAIPVANSELIFSQVVAQELETAALSGATFPQAEKNYRAEVGYVPLVTSGNIYRARIASKGS